MTEHHTKTTLGTKTAYYCHGDINEAKVLVIGHDPRLQKSDTIAGFALFANYYFEGIPSRLSEQRKYGLAKSTYEYVNEITSHQYSNDEIIITNLCNASLVHAPKRKTVYIPEANAQAGIRDIHILLQKSRVETIFAMSQQVNYWLQKL